MIIAESTILDRVEHILASGSGTLDFAVVGGNNYHTWHGREDAHWTVSGVEKIENIEEDRIIFYPESKFFRCEIEANGEEQNEGPVRCVSE